MATVTTSFYHDTYHGTFGGADGDLTLLLERAEEVIDSKIYLSGFTVSDITGDDKNAVWKAVCAQADCINNNGGLSSMTDTEVASATLGRFSFTEKSENGKSSNPNDICALAVNYLQPTGLLYRGL